MSFTLPQCHTPDFQETRFWSASEARFEPTLEGGVAPGGYRATTTYPEYFEVRGRWLLVEESHMDCMAALRDGKAAAVEFRSLGASEPVVMGCTEDVSESICTYPLGSVEEKEEAETFAFRRGRSREAAYSMDHDSIYELLRHGKGHGRILWVMRPVYAFDHDARATFAALTRGGHTHGPLVGDTLAIHDLKVGYLDTALGQDIYTQKSMPSGHYNHIDTLNAIRLCGSTAAFVEAGKARDSIIYERVRDHIPYVLVGSVRDDGPLPKVYENVYEGQNAMRTLVREATTVICMASTLHTVATGNMTPSYWVVDGVVCPVYFYSVDVSEFTVNKLRDRGSLPVHIIVTNVQDFVTNAYKSIL